MRSRRAGLPAAEDLFRTTRGPVPPEARERAPVRVVPPVEEAQPARAAPSRRSSGRVRHDEKMTVYLTAAELHELEQARLTLRSDHGLRADRGRLVREALAAVLSDFEARGADSVLVRRLGQSAGPSAGPATGPATDQP